MYPYRYIEFVTECYSYARHQLNSLYFVVTKIHDSNGYLEISEGFLFVFLLLFPI